MSRNPRTPETNLVMSRLPLLLMLMIGTVLVLTAFAGHESVSSAESLPLAYVESTTLAPATPACSLVWRVASSPSRIGYLLGLEVILPTDIWAVGEVGGSQQFETLVQHWDGTQWRRVPSPSFGTAGENVLNAVSAVSANDI